ncbi:MAG TPA: pyruvate, phosphate dikinase [Chloroflexota bacterium]|nr:pyruvate, phosphate dikinase [Chloroflexota bacterium]
MSQSASATGKKWVYLFEEGDGTWRELLGGKGAGLASMTKAGLPVPPGFTITTEACNEYYAQGEKFPEGMWEQALEALKDVEKKTGKKLGDPGNPLLVSVRSGAKFSMPGMMDTVLNLGLNDETVKGLAALTNDERFAYDAYRRFISLFGRIVQGLDGAQFEHVLDEYKKKTGAKSDAELPADALKEIVKEYKEIVKAGTGKDFPNDPFDQLRLAIGAVFGSWNGKRAIDYRNYNKIPHNLGTAVNVQTMVFGNMGWDSGTGVAFTRNPSTGEKALYGEFLVNAQGEDVVAGIRTPEPIARLQDQLPTVAEQFKGIAQRLEGFYRDVQDMEFTVEHGRLFMLQTRAGKRTAQAAVKIAVDMVKEGIITKEEAIMRIEPNHVVQLLLPNFDPKAKAAAAKEGRLLSKGLNASPGAAVGVAVFDADRAEEIGNTGQRVVLVRQETSPDDVHGMIAAQGVLTSRGGATSHAAVVARGMGKPCVSGAEGIVVDVDKRQFTAGGKVVKEGEVISIDGATGEVFYGEIPVSAASFAELTDLDQILKWSDETRKLGVWANADYPRDAIKAREYGAEGIGLCRTEHMFMETDRLPIVQRMILAAPEATRLSAEIQKAKNELATTPSDKKAAAEAHIAALEKEAAGPVGNYRGALAELLPIQKGDFVGIFRAMAGLPVIIRLIDPPLHEFLPDYETLLVEVTELRLKGGNPQELAEKERLLQAVESMREANPMLGLRGCRLGILYPEIVEMQVKAIIGAACDLTKEGVVVKPEIMIPLVGHINELHLTKELLEPVAEEVMKEAGVKVNYLFGTMIEIPRAALTADEIAKDAQFFSFGTNDLTQTTFGYSRDDAEGKFLLQYVDRKILPVNPFQTLDRSGVGKLIKMAVELGRATRPELSVGICGEHGGDPSSIEFCNSVGLNYVSCSPFRVPVARLAAAQAAIGQAERDK